MTHLRVKQNIVIVFLDNASLHSFKMEKKSASRQGKGNDIKPSLSWICFGIEFYSITEEYDGLNKYMMNDMLERIMNCILQVHHNPT